MEWVHAPKKDELVRKYQLDAWLTLFEGKTLEEIQYLMSTKFLPDDIEIRFYKKPTKK